MTDTLPLSELLRELNRHLTGMGMLELALISPKDCIPAPVNARYFLPETMRQLVDNIRDAGHLESVPLVYRKDEVPGKVFTISGHHRIDAAKAAELELILVLVTPVQSEEEVVSKQLAHNALTGQDDPVILAELFGRIKDIQLRLQTGLNDAVSKISYPSLNFRLGATKQFSLVFVPEDAILYDRGMEELEEFARSIPTTGSTEIRLLPAELWDRFAAIMRRVKKQENIKSNATAMLFLLNLAEETMRQVEADHGTKSREEGRS